MHEKIAHFTPPHRSSPIVAFYPIYATGFFPHNYTISTTPHASSNFNLPLYLTFRHSSKLYQTLPVLFISHSQPLFSFLSFSFQYSFIVMDIKSHFAFCPVSSRQFLFNTSNSSKLIQSSHLYRRHRNVNAYTIPLQRKCVQMIEQNTLVAVATILVGTGGGIALVAWTEKQGKRTDQRQNLQPCVECKGETTVVCNVCNGTIKDPIDNSKVCSYCEGKGNLKCFNCAGSGVQPRFLDRFVIHFFLISISNSISCLQYPNLVSFSSFTILIQTISRRFYGLTHKTNNSIKNIILIIYTPVLLSSPSSPPNPSCTLFDARIASYAVIHGGSSLLLLPSSSS